MGKGKGSGGGYDHALNSKAMRTCVSKQIAKQQFELWSLLN